MKNEWYNEQKRGDGEEEKQNLWNKNTDLFTNNIYKSIYLHYSLHYTETIIINVTKLLTEKKEPNITSK